MKQNIEKSALPFTIHYSKAKDLGKQRFTYRGAGKDQSQSLSGFTCFKERD